MLTAFFVIIFICIDIIYYFHFLNFLLLFFSFDLDRLDEALEMDGGVDLELELELLTFLYDLFYLDLTLNITSLI
jgi:hypothetical protein